MGCFWASRGPKWDHQKTLGRKWQTQACDTQCYLYHRWWHSCAKHKNKSRINEKKGDWAKAAASYHSGTEDLQKAYLGRLEQNLKVANARLDDFREMAGASAPRTAQAPTAPARRMPTTGVFWTAWLGREAHDGQGGRTLFGPNNIAPILPALSKGS